MSDQRSGASHMTKRQFAMALERIQMYLAAMDSKSPPRGFNSGELGARGGHRAALSAALH